MSAVFRGAPARTPPQAVMDVDRQGLPAPSIPPSPAPALGAHGSHLQEIRGTEV